MSKINRTDDIYIKLNLTTQQANEEIHKLIKSTEELRKTNQEYRKEKARLAESEGDHSAEIKRLNEHIDANKRQIEANNREITKWEGKIDLSRKTAAQLGKELKKLKRDLNNTSKAVEPKKYKDLEEQIRRTEKALAEAQRSTRGFMASFMSLDKIATAIKGFFMGLATVITNQVIGAFKNVVATIQDFSAATSKLAAILGSSKQGIKDRQTRPRS